MFQYQPTPAESGTRAYAPHQNQHCNTAKYCWYLSSTPPTALVSFFLLQVSVQFFTGKKLIKRLREQFLTYSYVCKIYCKPNISMWIVFILLKCIPTAAMAQSCRLKFPGWPKFYSPAEAEILQAFRVIKSKCSHTFIWGVTRYQKKSSNRKYWVLGFGI